MIVIPLAKLESAATTKPQGYYEACLASGTVVEDSLQLTEQAFAQLRSRYAQPPLGSQLLSLAGAVVAECGAAIAGEPFVTEQQKSIRLSICEACEFFTPHNRRCSRCGCWMDSKAGLRSQDCPESKWP